LAYETPSSLIYGTYTLQSSEGVQQIDPLGPFLFSLAISDALSKISYTFTAGYLDDITLGDTCPKPHWRNQEVSKGSIKNWT